MLYSKNLLAIKSLGLGVLLVGLAQVPVMGFELDLFDDVNDTLFNRQEVYENVFIRGSGFQDQPTDTDTFTSSSVVGNNRHLKITIEPAENTSNSSELIVDANNSILQLITNSNIKPNALVVQNGSNDIDFADLNADASLNLDLEADGDGDDSIGISIKFSDQTVADDEETQTVTEGIGLTLDEGTDGDDDGTTHTVYLDIPKVGIGSSETLYFEFAEYETAGVNINSIEYVALGINGNYGSDIDIDFLETAQKPVPIPFEFSPGLGLLISGGFFSFLIIRSKKANKSKQA